MRAEAKNATHTMRMYGGNFQNLHRQTVAAAQICKATHKALAEFHTMGGEYVIPSFADAEARIHAALGGDPRNRRGHRL